MTDIPPHDRFALPGEICDGEKTPTRDGSHVPPATPSREREVEERIGTADWTVFTGDRQAAFLDTLSVSGNVRLACQAAGVSPQTAYRARRKDAALGRAWDAACLAARPVAEAALGDRAINGWEEPVFYRGEEIARKPRFDARLMLAHLARLDRLAESPGAMAALPLLDDAIEGLREGCPLAETLPEPEPAEVPQDTVPGVPSSSTDDEDMPEPCERCGGRCNGPEWALTQADCQWLGNRLSRMDRARPRGADKPHLLANGGLDAGDIEALQLIAFEAGVERWWELTEPPEEDSPLLLAGSRRRSGGTAAGGGPVEAEGVDDPA